MKWIPMVCLVGGCIATSMNKTAERDIRTEVAGIREVVVQKAEEVKASVGNQVQQGLINRTVVDNRTYDTFSQRVMLIGLVLLAMSYPVGKLIWEIVTRGCKIPKVRK